MQKWICNIWLCKNAVFFALQKTKMLNIFQRRMFSIRPTINFLSFSRYCFWCFYSDCVLCLVLTYLFFPKKKPPRWNTKKNIFKKWKCKRYFWAFLQCQNVKNKTSILNIYRQYWTKEQNVRNAKENVQHQIYFCKSNIFLFLLPPGEFESPFPPWKGDVLGL